MKKADNVSSLKDSELICIDDESEIFNGYILETFEAEPGTLTIILSHDSEFYEEDYINVAFDPKTGTIYSPNIYLLDQ